MRIAIFAAAGAKLLDGTAIVLTGLVRDGAWEANLPTGTLVHGFVVDSRLGYVSGPDYGHAETLGPIVSVTAGAAITTGDELTHSTTDGTMVKGRPADRKCAIALQSATKGAKCFAMVRQG